MHANNGTQITFVHGVDASRARAIAHIRNKARTRRASCTSRERPGPQIQARRRVARSPNVTRVPPNIKNENVCDRNQEGEIQMIHWHSPLASSAGHAVQREKSSNNQQNVECARIVLSPEVDWPNKATQKKTKQVLTVNPRDMVCKGRWNVRVYDESEQHRIRTKMIESVIGRTQN